MMKAPRRRLLVMALAPLWLLGCAAQALEAPGPPGPLRPSSYDEFVSVAKYDSLAEAIGKERFIWLPPGTYTVNNPLSISRETALLIHGGDRTNTRIVGTDPKRPLFVIEKAPLVGLASVLLRPSASESAADARVLVASNLEPTTLEIQDCRINTGALELRGPGSYRIQGTLFRPHGWLQNPILVDHPDASFVMVGGDISNLSAKPQIPTREAYHVRVRRGRVRIYGTSFEAALGPADVRIDSASAHGAHVFTAVRSEGNNGSNRGAYRSALVQVPASDEKIDIVLKSNIGAWGAGGYGNGRLLEYNGAGTLWLLGNNVQKGARALVEGTAPKARIVAIGNFVYDDSGVLPVKAERKIRAASVYFHSLVERSRPGDDSPEKMRRVNEKPRKRFVDPKHEPGPRGPLPAVPDDEIPLPVDRPALLRALPGMRDVRKFGAIGDGVHDDTKAIQAALDDNCDSRLGSLVFLPAGTYRVTAALRYNVPGSCPHRTGGWIAGAGRDRTRIVRDPGDKGSVLETHSMSGVTIQGITFQTTPWRSSDPSPIQKAAFALEGGGGPATHFVSFYDTRFDGGKYGLGVLLVEKAGSGEGNMMIHSEFRNARFGLGIGGFNVLNNNVYFSDFVDNEVMIGHGEEGNSGGIWTVFGATSRGTRKAEFWFRGSGAGAWYFYGLDSKAPRLVSREFGGGSFPLLFDRSDLRPADSDGLRFEFSQNGGPIFLHSRVSDLRLFLVGKARSLFAVNLASEVSGWDKARLKGPNARLFEFSE